MSGWEELLGQVGQNDEEELALSQEGTVLTEEAEACRSSSVEGDDVAVPLTPQTSDIWWVQIVKAATRKLHPKKPISLEHPVRVLSNCTGSFAEAAAMKAGPCHGLV